MPDLAADPAPRRTPKALASLAGLACLACCLLPAPITAGVVGAGASAVVGWLPAVALALTALAGAIWWFGRRHTSCGCGTSDQGGCGCKTSTDPLRITGTGPH
jgi:mercuric ion transport protein